VRGFAYSSIRCRRKPLIKELKLVVEGNAYFTVTAYKVFSSVSNNASWALICSYYSKTR